MTIRAITLRALFHGQCRRGLELFRSTSNKCSHRLNVRSPLICDRGFRCQSTCKFGPCQLAFVVWCSTKSEVQLVACSSAALQS